jgi:hypothetical protein
LLITLNSARHLSESDHNAYKPLKISSWEHISNGYKRWIAFCTLITAQTISLILLLGEQTPTAQTLDALWSTAATILIKARAKAFQVSAPSKNPEAKKVI